MNRSKSTGGASSGRKRSHPVVHFGQSSATSADRPVPSKKSRIQSPQDTRKTRAKSSPAKRKSAPASGSSSSGPSRTLLGLTDHFPDFKLPEGRRLTRSIARQFRRSSESQDQPDSPGPSTSRKIVTTKKSKEKEGEQKNSEAGPSSSKSDKSKRQTSSKVKQESGSGQSAGAQSAATTGICQSIGNSENRVFPGSESSGQGGTNVGAAGGVPANASAAEHSLADMELRALPSALRPPGHFLGSLMPRMQNLLAGPHAQQSAKINSIMEGIKSSNELRQSESALELAEMLLLGNEESLPHLPVKEIMHLIMTLLQKEHNLELMLTAARCITNLLEALPRAVPVVLEAVPLLLEKLKRIECIDVAEQALTALEVLSRRHGKTIMTAGGIGATTSHLDFFSLQSQRVALQISANCAQFVTAADFNNVRECLAELTQRLQLEDKRSLESVCSVFARLVDNLRNTPDKLREVAAHGLLKNIQQLLLIQPPAIGSQCFQSVIRMLRQLCTRCNDLAVLLVQMGFARTLRFLIIGTDDVDMNDFELLNRPPQQLQELVLLIGELLPKLPNTDIFEIDTVMIRQSSTGEAICWQYKDENSQWHNFSLFDSKVLEVAYQSREHEVTLQSMSHTCTVDLDRMMQFDEISGVARQVQRKIPNNNNNGNGKVKTELEKDVREEMLRENPDGLGDNLIRWLFPVLVEVDGSSAGPAIRFESMRTMLRMIYPSGSDLLKEVLNDLPLASHLSSALSSSRSKDLCVVASGLQIVYLLTEKLPHVYGLLFRREGVAHQIEKLANMANDETPRNSPSRSNRDTEDSSQSQSFKTATTQASSSSLSTAASFIASTQRSSEQTSNGSKDKDSTSVKSLPQSGGKKKMFLPSIKFPTWGKGAQPSASDEGQLASGVDKVRPSSSSASTSRLQTGSSQSRGRRMANHPSNDRDSPFNSAQMARRTIPMPQGLMSPLSSSTTAVAYVGVPQGLRPMPAFTVPSQNGQMLSQMQKKRLRQWIKTTAQNLLDEFFKVQMDLDNEQVEALERMAVVAKQLTQEYTDHGFGILHELRNALLEAELSAFELKQSGLIVALTQYLTDKDSLVPERNERLKRFAKVFMGIENITDIPLDVDAFKPFQIVVARIVSSVSQLEQFHVRTNDLFGLDSQGSLRGANALRFFQTHQIRCTLRRHPECKQLKEWRHGHGSIKVDPFTQIAVIERYLVDRGVSLKGSHSGDDSSGEESNDATSDEELEDQMEGLAGSSSSAVSRVNIRLELMIDDQVLNPQMSVLQAIRQYGQHTFMHVPGQLDPVQMAAGIWVNTHVIWYRLSRDMDPGSIHKESLSSSEQPSSITVPPTKKKSSSKEKKSKIDEKLWQDGTVPDRLNPLDVYLTTSLGMQLDDPCAQSLNLLRILYGLNRYSWCLFKDQLPLNGCVPVLPLSAFICQKLSAKVSRQLQDVLSVATQQTPQWITDLATATPFVLPFYIRRQLLYCVAFGRDRALMHLVNQTDPTNANNDGHTQDTTRLTPRLERRKVSVKRDDLLKQAEDILGRMGSSRAMLEVGFDGEVGTGFGPTLEFYSTVSKELQRFNLKLWAGDKIQSPSEHNGGAMIEYAEPKNGLYPSAMHANSGGKQRENRVKKFEFIGRLMGQALIDGRMLDLSLNPLFYAWLLNNDCHKRLCVADLRLLDTEICHSLTHLVNSSQQDLNYMQQTFTLPGQDSFDLCKSGHNLVVDSSNVMKYVQLVSHWRLVAGVQREMEAVKRGIESVMDTKHLALFYPEEMDQLFCGMHGGEGTESDVVWSGPSLLAALKPDHGYTHDSDQIKWLVEWMSKLNTEQRRKLLQFVSGSPKLPVGGFRALNPPLTVVRKSGQNVDADLPSAMTCYNYLKVPAYSSYEIFVERFSVALEHVYSFFLT